MSFLLRFAVCILACFCFTIKASAQWVTETYDLKEGYNAIWLSIDCSDRSVNLLLNGKPEIIEVWQWNVDASSTHFTESPAVPSQPDSQWKVWKRGLPAETTLSLLSANAAYIVRVADGIPTYSLSLKGKPVAPRYLWKSSGVNFVGFPMVDTSAIPMFDTTAHRFANFFSFSDVLNQSQPPPIYYYIGGDLTANPRRLDMPNNTIVIRGQAYWVQTNEYADFYGPLKISALNGDGIEFGAKLNSSTIQVKNVTDPSKNQTVTATFNLVGSESAPGESTSPLPVPLRVRGVRDANLQFTYTDFPTTVTLAPGEEVDLVLDPDRTQLTTPDQFYASILQVTDSLNHSRIDLSVSAIGSSKTGVWVGEAVINSVNRVETLSGPEFDAPRDTPDGEGAESTSSVINTITTAAGETTDTLVFDGTFDPDNKVYLNAAGLLEENVIVTAPGGTPVFVSGTDYSLVSTDRGTVTNGGSGYTEAPEVTISGGGGTAATAVASLSAKVTGVSIISGGSGYTSIPTVSFTGDGSGAAALATVATIDGETHVLTDITITNGGFGYSQPPIIEITGGGGNGAIANSVISGGVGHIRITEGGSGYTGAPQVTFTAVNNSGSGASATVEVVDGVVTGVDAVESIDTGAIGAEARFSVTSVSPAPIGVPEGSVVSTVTSTSKLITLNGKSHLSTKRVSTGGAAAAPSNFPIRLILHTSSGGTPSTLLQQLYLGERDGVAYAGVDEATLAAIVTAAGTTPEGSLARVSSASFPRGESWPGTGAFGGAVSFTVALGYDAETNPFVHTYHPDHDNWDDRYENKLPEGRESFEVTRQITLTFSPTPPPGVSDLTWGVTTLGGTYTEIIHGLRSEEIGISGNFILRQVSEVPSLTPAQP